MVKLQSICLVIASCVLVLHSPIAQARQGDKRAKPRSITRIQITEVGKSDDDKELEKRFCKAFRPSKGDVKRFFLHAYAVPAKIGAHDRYSPCYAKGSVEFSDNTRGTWKLSSSGTGALAWDTGDVAYLFQRDYRWTDPFECTYGLSSEGEC